MLLGLALMVAEAFVPSFGALGVGGVVAFVLGSLILIDTEVPGFGISIPLILTLAVTSAVLLVFVIGMAVQARRRPVVSGAEELIGCERAGRFRLPRDGQRAPAWRGLVRAQRGRHRPGQRQSGSPAGRD